jgi:hypothetical protein
VQGRCAVAIYGMRIRLPRTTGRMGIMQTWTLSRMINNICMRSMASGVRDGVRERMSGAKTHPGGARAVLSGNALTGRLDKPWKGVYE